MKKGVVIVNTARGAIMDEEALVDALDNGHVACAGLDVCYSGRCRLFCLCVIWGPGKAVFNTAVRGKKGVGHHDRVC